MVDLHPSRLLRLAPCAALLAVSGCHHTPGSARETTVQLSSMAALDSIFAAYDSPDVPGASVLVIKDGSVAVSRSYGLADVEARTRASDSTNYRLASLSKQFTATAIMLLAREGRLRYDDRAAELLPGFPAHGRDVRIRHLLNHTSGIWAYESFVPREQTVQVKDSDVLTLIQQAESTYFPPGTAYRYSNTGYALLALIVERLSGQSYASFLRDRIFAPLGMDGTVAYEAGVSTVQNRAFGYTIRPSGITRTDQSSTSAVLGDGGIYSSIHDLAKWDRALESGALVSRELQAVAWTPATLANGTTTRYGFGWFVDREDGGLRLSHHGETSGFTNFILKYPERRLTVIVLTNRRGGAPWDLAPKVAALAAFR